MVILNHLWEKIKAYQEEIYLLLIIVLSGFFGFGLGRLSQIEDRKVPITIEDVGNTPVNATSSEKIDQSKDSFVASKNGKKYYFSWCDGAQKISKKNIVSFNSREEAEKAGYDKASNCPGL
ncbi:MAG: hypothetical protein WCO84_00405 [bacterium]